MQIRHFARRFNFVPSHGFRTVSLAAALALIAACDGGSSSSRTTDVVVTPPDPAPPSTPVSFGSNAVKGPLENATITLTDANGQELSSFVADTGSTFNLSIPDTAAFPVIVSTSGGVDTFTTQNVADLSLTLKGVVFNTEQVTVNINPISTLMVEIALATNDFSEQTMNDVFFDWQTYNFGLPEGFNPVSSLQNRTNTPQVLMAYETFFEVIRRVSNQLSITPNQVIEGIAADLTDGVLDGAGTANVDPLMTSLFNNLASVVLLEALTGELVIDSGGTTQKTLASSDIQTATLTLTGNEATDAVAALPPNQRVLGLVDNVLAVSAATTTDSAASAAITASRTTIAAIPRSNRPSAAATTTLTGVSQSVRASLVATAQNINATNAQTGNQTSGQVFARPANNSIPAPVGDFLRVNGGQSATLNVRANDPEVVDGFSAISILQEPEHGTTAINPDNTISYLADLNYLGTDSFVYGITDEDGDRGAASVTVRVNVVPIARNDSVGTVGTDPIVVSVLANDTQLIDTPLTIAVTSGPANGATTVNGNDITYTANENFVGNDTFTYQITDASGDTASANVTVSVTAASADNPSVFAVADSFTAPTGQTTEFNVASNDLQVTDTPLTVTATSTNATITVDGTTLSYTPNPEFGGDDEFTYTITDASGDSSTATVSVFVDTIPIAGPHIVFLQAGDSASINLLDDATGLGNPPITAVIVTNPQNGTIVKDGTTLTYRANLTFSGDDVMTFGLVDADGDRGDSTVTFRVTANNVPQAVPDRVTTPINTAVTVDVVANDNGLQDAPIRVTLGDVTNGQATLSGNEITFTPTAGFGGNATIGYTIFDEDNEQSSTTLTVFVDDTPVAQNDSVQTLVSTALEIDVLANDSGLANTPLVLTVTQGVSNGTTAVQNGKILYTPTTGFAGTDNFTYSVKDSDGDVATAEVTILVDDRPTLTNQSLVTPVNTPIQVNLLANALGVGNTPLTFAVTTQPANGTIALDQNILTYTPNANFAATDSLTYTVTDNDGDFGTATVSIFMNDTPVAVNDTGLETPINTALANINILANDTGLLNTPITVTISDVVGGTVVLGDVNTPTFTPTSGFASTASFNYLITDGNGDTATGSVSIFVDDTPVANPDSVDTPVSTAVALNVLANDTGLANAPVVVTTSNDFGGVSTVDSSNIVTFTPTAGFANSASFTYTVRDADSDTATSSGTVFVDDTPVANDDTIPETLVGTTTPAFNLLGNDTGLGNTPLTLETNSVVGGVVNLDPFSNTITYTPNSGFAGNGSFTYTVRDTDGDSASANASIFVDDRPVGVPDSVGTPIGTPLDIAVTANDTGLLNGGLSIEFGTPPSGSLGTAEINGLTVTYTPTIGTPSTDSFTYTVRDADGDTSAATTVTVGIGFAASDDTVSVTENITDATRILGAASRSIDVLANDAQGPGGATIISVDTTGTNGTVAFTSSTITYTPPVGAAPGSDSFTYTIRNASLAQDSTGTVNVSTASICTLTNVHCVGPGSGDEEFATIQDAVDATAPGHWVKLRGGTYVHAQEGTPTTFVEIENSGTDGNPITMEAFDGESVVLQGFGFPEDGNDPERSNGVLVLLTGDYVTVRNIEAHSATRYCIEVRGSHTTVEDMTVRDCWLDNINVGRRIDDAINNVTIRRNLLFRSRHGSGLLLSRPADPREDETPPTLGFMSDILVERNISFNNGRKTDGNQVPPIGGDPAGGGNSDGFAMGKQCLDELTDNDSPVGEYDGVDSLCPRITYRQNIAFGNIDDGFDTTLGNGSILDRNMSFGNGPEGRKGFKFVRDLTGTIKVVGNIAFNNLDVGIENRFVNTGFVFNNTSINHQFDAGRGFFIGTDDNDGATTPLVTVGNNLASLSRPNNDFSIPSDGTGISITNHSGEDDGDPQIGNVNFDKDSFSNITLVEQADDSNLVDPKPSEDVHLPFYFVLNFASGTTVDAMVTSIFDQVRTAFLPQPGSPLIDAGTFNANVHCATADDDAVTPHDPNDLTCHHWNGSAPDIGAFETD